MGTICRRKCVWVLSPSFCWLGCVHLWGQNAMDLIDYFKRGTIYLEHRRLSQAIETFAKAIMENPSDCSSLPAPFFSGKAL